MAKTKQPNISEVIDESAEVIGKVWPLYSFVTSNPLSGFEDRAFIEAVERAEGLLGGHGTRPPTSSARPGRTVGLTRTCSWTNSSGGISI